MQNNNRKIFSIEKKLLTRKIEEQVKGSNVDVSSLEIRKVLNKIDKLDKDIKKQNKILNRVSANSDKGVISQEANNAPINNNAQISHPQQNNQPVYNPNDPNEIRKKEEADKIKSEIDDIYKAISLTKKELSSLHHTSFSGEQLNTITNELDSIVQGTEAATNEILVAVENIDDDARELMASITSETQQGQAHDIAEQVIKIYEACNFQDLIGQRTTKVVNTLKYIEQRVVNLMDAWGGQEHIATHEPDLDEFGSNDELLHGPLDDDHPDKVSQSDIDDLFN